MGCIGYLVDEFTKLKKRKGLKSFDITGYPHYITAVNKYNMIIAITQNKIVAIDYEELKIKTEINYDFGNCVLEVKTKFSDKDDILEIRGRDLLHKVIHELKLKISANSIVESSKKKETIPNFPKPDKILEKLAFYDNGSVIMFTEGQFESSNEKGLSYLDKNGKVLSSCEVPKDVKYLERWYNEKYAAFVSLMEVQGDSFNPDKTAAADTLHIYKLSNMSKVAEVLVKKSGFNLEPSKVIVSPANDKTLLLSFFGEIHILDLESGKIVNKITFCLKEKSHIAIVKESDDTFWSISEIGHCHQWKLDGTKLIATTGTCSATFTVLKEGKKLAFLNRAPDLKKKIFNTKLIIESNEELEKDTSYYIG